MRNEKEKQREADAARGRYKANPEKIRAASKKWRLNHPESRKITRRKTLLKTSYGMSLEDFDRMVLEQGNKCLICGADGEAQPKGKLCIDHCHKKGNVRGLLCYACNTGIGYFRDNPVLLNLAADYVVRNYEKVNNAAPGAA